MRAHGALLHASARRVSRIRARVRSRQGRGHCRRARGQGGVQGQSAQLQGQGACGSCRGKRWQLSEGWLSGGVAPAKWETPGCWDGPGLFGRVVGPPNLRAVKHVDAAGRPRQRTPGGGHKGKHSSGGTNTVQAAGSPLGIRHGWTEEAWSGGGNFASAGRLRGR